MSNPHERRLSPSTDPPPPVHGQTLFTERDSASPAAKFSGETLALSGVAMVSPLPGTVQRLAGYEVLGELGRGGMGIVYKARQRGLDRLVALKMILHADHAGAEDRARFAREAKALAGLRHEGIVHVYEVGEHEGKPFFSLEYVEGGSLDKRLAGTPLPPKEAARLVQQLAEAMQAAHEAGIVHRDLKPANVLLAEGQASGQTLQGRPPACPLDGCIPKITDFGLAKKQDEGGLSVSGAVLGTPSYMAPEQAACKVHAVDARTDVYALGAILYECLTGRPPFKGATVPETLVQVMSEEPVAVRALQPSVPRDLETVCLKCLQKEPARRYGSAQNLADDLARFLRGEPVRARPAGRLERGWCRRNPLVAGLGAAAVLALIAGTIVSMHFAFQADARAHDARGYADEADRNAVEADEAKRKAQRISAGLAIDRGLSLCEQGEVDWGLLWLARSLEYLPNEDSDLQRTVRANLVDWYGRVNPLDEVFSQEGPAEVAAWTPDGKTLLTPGSDGVVRFWDSKGALLDRRIRTTSRPMTAVAVHPRGTLVLTASGADTSVTQLW
jgi:hypothetical protein